MYRIWDTIFAIVDYIVICLIDVHSMMYASNVSDGVLLVQMFDHGIVYMIQSNI